MENKISVDLINKTLDYLSSCPYAGVRKLMNEWEAILSPIPANKKEDDKQKTDGGDSKDSK